jgi:dTDP-glucose 4,6-dehydratase
MSEQHPLSAQSPYAASKIAADQLSLSWFRSFELPVSIVRPFNTYGPGQSARAIIPTIITQALSGATVKLGSVAPTRDFSYVDDTVAAFVAVSTTAAAVGEVFNVGTGVETSVAQLVELVGAALGKRIAVETECERIRPALSEVSRLHADATKLRRVCGWESKVRLAEGIARTVAWIRDNQRRFSPGRYAV